MKNKLPIIAAGIIILLVLLALCTYQLRVTEVAVVTTLGKPTVEANPGIHGRMPWPVQKISRLDNRAQLIQGRAREINTADNTNVITRVFAVWRIAEPLTFFNSLGSIAEAEITLKSLLESKQEAVIRAHKLEDFLGESANTVEEKLLASLNEEAGELHGVRVDFVGLAEISLAESNTASVFARMKQEQLRMAAGIRSEGEKNAKIIRDNAASKKAQAIAEADAKAKEIRGNAVITAAKRYQDFNKDVEFALFLRKLDALVETMSTKTTVIVDPSIPPFDLLEFEKVRAPVVPDAPK
jgi:modulator of FtsH protease HflC